MAKSTRISASSKKTPDEEIESPNAVYLDKQKIEQLAKEISEIDRSLDAFASAHVMRGIIHLASLSVPIAVMSKSLCIPRTRLKQILESVSVQREVTRLQTELYARDHEMMFKRLVPAAVNAIHGLMTNKKSKDNTRLAAAEYIVDRALGKPKEIQEIKTDMLAQVFGALKKKPGEDGPSQDGYLDAEFEKVAETKDPLEDLMGDKK